MATITLKSTVGEIVTRQPSLSRVFEKLRIDYCCGGKASLEDACTQKKLDPQTVLAMLDAVASESRQDSPEVNVAAMSLADLVDHIETTHHQYMWNEMPRLGALVEKVARVHGGEDSRLLDLLEEYQALAKELEVHMLKEERILFPLIRELEGGNPAAASPCGNASGPIRQMRLEHDQAGEALERMSSLTDGYIPPEWACNSYRAMLDALANFEMDLHQHVHKENNVLFPRALDLV